MGERVDEYVWAGPARLEAVDVVHADVAGPVGEQVPGQDFADRGEGRRHAAPGSAWNEVAGLMGFEPGPPSRKRQPPPALKPGIFLAAALLIGMPVMGDR